MKKKTEKTKRHYVIYILALFAAALAGAYVWALIRTNQYHDQITFMREELLVQVERERRVRDTAGVLASFKEERKVVKTLFKTPDDVISIIEDIEGLGSVIGAPVSVLQVQVDGEDPETREGMFTVSLLSEGSWKEMTHLVGLLDALPYHAKMNHVTLDTSDTPEGSEGSENSSLWVVRASLSIALKK